MRKFSYLLLAALITGCSGGSSGESSAIPSENAPLASEPTMAASTPVPNPPLPTGIVTSTPVDNYVLSIAKKIVLPWDPDRLAYDTTGTGIPDIIDHDDDGVLDDIFFDSDRDGIDNYTDCSNRSYVTEDGRHGLCVPYNSFILGTVKTTYFLTDEKYYFYPKNTHIDTTESFHNPKVMEWQRPLSGIVQKSIFWPDECPFGDLQATIEHRGYLTRLTLVHLSRAGTYTTGWFRSTGGSDQIPDGKFSDGVTSVVDTKVIHLGGRTSTSSIEEGDLILVWLDLKAPYLLSYGRPTTLPCEYTIRFKKPTN